MATQAPRVLMYSHDGMGLGHLRRTLHLAREVCAADPNASVLIATGGDEVDAFDLPPRTDVVRLPGLRKVANEHYVARRLSISAHDVHAVRAGILTALVESFGAHAVVVDKHVLGAKREMVGALERARERGAAALLGLRDILDEPAVVRADWMRLGASAAIDALYDRVLVYGVPGVVDLVGDYGLATGLAGRVRHCGYVTRTTAAPSAGPGEQRRDRPTVLACAGGGQDGFRVLEAFVAAAKGQPWDATVVAGPLSDHDDRARLRAAARTTGVEFLDFEPDLPGRIATADALVTMGGYNTLTEAVSLGTPTVCVPRTRPRTEQLIRARAFEAAGLLQTIDPDLLDPVALRRGIRTALGQRRAVLRARAHELLSFDGASTAAAHILDAAHRALGTGLSAPDGVSRPAPQVRVA